MPQKAFRRPLALASIVALGATVLSGASAAIASHGGTPGLLSSSNGTDALLFADGTTLGSFRNMRDASWSPDGSRAVFVADDNWVETVRYNDGENGVYRISERPPEEEPPAFTTRTDPVYSGDGSTIYWAASTSDGPSRIEASVANCCFGFRTYSPDDGASYTNPDTDDLGDVVAQRQELDDGDPVGDPEIGFVADGTYTQIIADAADPAISPDGSRVAFVRDDQIWVSDPMGDNLVQVTSNAGGHEEPTWSPDGLTIAFAQGGAVATAPADGSAAANPTVVAGLTGKPAYRTQRRNTVSRLGGSNRFNTSALISQSYWAARGSSQGVPANAVVLSRSDTFADALGGATLAAAKQGPLLMTPPDSLNATTQAEIQRILPPGKTVYLLGGTGAISAAVETRIRGLGYQTVRFAGSNRYDTSIAIANAISPNPKHILAATGTDFPDALAAGAAAGSFNVPGSGTSAVLVLTNNSTLPASIRSYLDTHRAGADLYGVGGLTDDALAAAYGRDNVTRVAGASRYQTAQFTAYEFFGPENYVGLAIGDDWPDALAGGALMANLNGPLLLTVGTAGTLRPEVGLVADEASAIVHTGVVFGATTTLNAAQANGLGTLISGPGGFTTTSTLGITAASGAARASSRTPKVDPARGLVPPQVAVTDRGPAH